MRQGAFLGATALPILLLLGCNGHLERADQPPPPEQTARSANPADDGADVSSDADEGSYDADSGDDSPQPEGARTQEMDNEARDLRRQYDEARANAKTPAEAERAYQEFERKRAHLDAVGNGENPDGSTAGSSNDAYPPPP